MGKRRAREVQLEDHVVSGIAYGIAQTAVVWVVFPDIISKVDGMGSPLTSLKGHAGLVIILYAFFNLFEKKSTFRSSYTISSIILACETRLTENGMPPERNLRMVSLIN